MKHGGPSIHSGLDYARLAAVNPTVVLCSLSGFGLTGPYVTGDRALRRELQDLFATRTTEEWLAFGLAHNCPIAPVNDAGSIVDDPQLRARSRWLPAEVYGADQMATPVRLVDDDLPDPLPAPALGQHTDEILTGVLGTTPTASPFSATRAWWPRLLRCQV